MLARAYLAVCLTFGCLVSPADARGTGSPGVGPQGDQGPKGDRGDAGPAGSQGPTGDTGSAGPMGSQGPAGATGPGGPAGSKGDTGPQGSAGAAGLAGSPKRIERYTATSSAASVATFTWPACTTTADVDVIPTWSGDQMIIGGVTSQTLSGATIAVKRSKGTLLLAAGPFEPAPSTPVQVRVICN